jgi:predicted LPLAT superfamily acyltransferase
VKDVLEESVTWTADQTAIAIVMFYLEHKKESIKVKSINPEAEKLIRSISRHSAKAKIKIKKRNLENLDY